MTSITFADQYILSNGEILNIPSYTLDHLQAHPEVTPEILEAAAKLLNPPPYHELTTIDLMNQFGLWGKSGLVEVPEANLFAFRKNRIVPSSVVDHPGIPASKLDMVTKPTKEGGFLLISCWCSDGLPVKPEPITPKLDPRTPEGLKLRQEYLEFWSRHALALGVTSIDNNTFISTWDDVIARWGNTYHQ